MPNASLRMQWWLRSFAQAFFYVGILAAPTEEGLRLLAGAFFGLGWPIKGPITEKKVEIVMTCVFDGPKSQVLASAASAA